MVSDCRVVFASAVIQQMLRESPVSSESHKALAVHIHLQSFIRLRFRVDKFLNAIVHLAHTALERDLVRDLAVKLESERYRIKLRISIAYRPPQTRIIELQSIQLDESSFSRLEILRNSH